MSAAPAKDTNAHPSDAAEDAEAKLPSRGEDPEDNAAVPTAKRPGGLINDFRDTMKGIAESVTGTSSKKRKNVPSAKPAAKPKKRSSVCTPTDGLSPNEAAAPNEGSKANAVTPARPS